MAYQYGVGGTSPILPPAAGIARAHTPVGVLPGSPPATQGAVQPGSLTYTTSQAPDGSIMYHCFKCVAIRVLISARE